MSTDKQTEVRSTVEALSTERALKLARQLISNLRTHSWTTSDEQFVLKAIDEALAEQPAQRTWAWLTDEEIEQCMKQAYATVQGRNLEHAFANAIEAKLRERNEHREKNA